MNKQDFLDSVLTSLGFSLQGNLITKDIQGNRLSVDVANETLVYPEDKGLKINERQTCNFSSSENFVVFECVHRLLEKGYQPKHIDLTAFTPPVKEVVATN